MPVGVLMCRRLMNITSKCPKEVIIIFTAFKIIAFLVYFQANYEIRSRHTDETIVTIESAMQEIAKCGWIVIQFSDTADD
jgi:hypothetical protein